MINLARIDSEELEELIRSTIASIEKGKGKNYRLVGNIEFEVAVVSVKKGKGGVRLLVVDASGKYGKETVSRIKFKISEKAEIAVAFG